MGVFDLPAPLLDWCDRALAAALPDAARLVLWAALGGALSMWLYRLFSPQARLSAVKAEVGELRRQSLSYDGDMAGLYPLLLRSIWATLRQFGLSLGPTVLASLPVLSLIVWLSNAYSYDLPAPGRAVEVAVSPAPAGLRWEPPRAAAPAGAAWTVTWPGTGGGVALVADGAAPLFSLPLETAVPVIHKKLWWNYLIGNPLGYLPAQAPVERVEVALPARRVWQVGPAWLAGWEATFFACLVLVSLAIKFLFRIH